MSVQFTCNTQHMQRTTSVPQGSGATMCCWLKITSYANWGNPMSVSNDGSNFFGMEFDSGGNVYFHVGASAGAGYTSSSASTGSYTGWWFVAFVASSSGLQGYYHKVGGSWTAATNITDPLPTQTGTADTLGFAWESYFGGSANGTIRMRCMRVWNVTLTATELQAERDSATPVKTSNLTFNNNGTAASTVGTDSTSTGNMTVTGTPTDQSDEPPIAQALAPGALTLDLALQAPTVDVASGGTITLQPGVLSLSLDQQAPTVVPGPISVAPGVIALSLAQQDPVIAVGGIAVSPPALSMSLDMQAPVLRWNQIFQPGAQTLTLAQQAPVLAPGNINVAPGAQSLSLAQQGPTLALGGISVAPGAQTLSLAQQAPALAQGQSLQPGALALSLTQQAPLVYGSSRTHWKPSENGRYFVDDYGSPVLVHGDSGWCSVDQLNQTEAKQYLTDLYSRHFNACVIAAPNSAFTTNPPENAFGDLPWSGTAFQSSLNAAYWDHLKWFFQQANARGIVPLFNPAYLGINSTEGWQNQVSAASNAQMQTYGVDVGTYLADCDFVVVAYGDNGGDATMQARLAAMLTGLLSVGKPRLVSFHNGPNSPSWETSATDTTTWHLSYVYEDPNGYTHVQVRQGYQQSSVKPVVMFESRYENPGTVNEERVRRQAWGAMTYGACGHCYGHELMWKFETGWADYLDDTVRAQMLHLQRFFNARRWWLLEPDFNATSTFLTAGRGTEAGAGFITGAVTADGSWGVAYLPNGSGPVTVDRTELSDTFTARWFNPRTGAYTAIGTSPNTGTEQFTRPDANDWVLVLEVDPVVELAMPAPLSLTLAQQAPVIAFTQTVSPGAIALSLSQQAPQLLSGNVNVAPGLIALSLAQQAPSLAMGAIALQPGLQSLSLAQQAPSLAMGAIALRPGAFALDLAMQSFSLLNDGTLQPGLLSLALTQQAPSLAFGNINVAPGAQALALDQQEPILLNNGTLQPGLQSLSLALHSPSVQAGGIFVLPGLLSLDLAEFVPVVGVQGPPIAMPAALALALALQDPSLAVGAIALQPGVLGLPLDLLLPTLLRFGTLQPGVLALALSVLDPTVVWPAILQPGAAALTLSIPAPLLGEPDDDEWVVIPMQ